MTGSTVRKIIAFVSYHIDPNGIILSRDAIFHRTGYRYSEFTISDKKRSLNRVEFPGKEECCFVLHLSYY